MTAMWNKGTIHYREGEGESNLPFENHQAESWRKKPKAAIRHSHYSLTLNALCLPMCVCVCVPSEEDMSQCVSTDVGGSSMRFLQVLD